MLDGAFYPSRERGGDHRAVALGGVAFVAQQRHGTAERLRERIEDSALGGQILAEVGEIAREIAVFTQPVADVARCAEGAFVLIVDTGAGENPGERVLGKALAA